VSGPTGNGRQSAPRLPAQVKCPQCGRMAPYAGNPWRPFCSERCKLIDLGQWAEGGYAIPSDDVPGGQDDEP